MPDRSIYFHNSALLSLGIVVSLLISMKGYSQADGFRFEHISSEQGLPSVNVTSIFQDRKGFLWFGTFHGIARYDGYSVLSYKHREGDETSIANSIVNAICDDSEGNIWVGHSRGLDKFDPSTEKFTHYVLNKETPSNDWSQHVLSLCEDKIGTLWVGTGDGLYLLNKTTGSFKWIKADSTAPYMSPASDNINAIYEDSSGTIWIATGKGFSKYDRAANLFYHYWQPSEKYKYVTNYNNPHWMHSIFRDSDGSFWFGTSGGIVVFDSNLENPVQYTHEPGDPGSLANNTVLSICEDRSGLIWISTKDGVDIFNKKTGIFLHCKHDDNDPASPGSNDAGAVLTDHSGAVWITSYGGGVDKYTPSNPYLRTYLIPGNKSGKVPPDALLEDKHGNIWAGTGHGLYKINPASGTIKNFVPKKDVYVILEDSRGTIWYSLLFGSLHKIDSDGRLSRIKDLTSWVSALCTGYTGNIWAGTSGGNVYSVNPVSGEIVQVLHESNFIESLYEDHNGLLWICVREAGLVRYDPIQKTYFNYSHDTHDSSSIGNNNVSRLIEDPVGNLWIIAGRTLNKYDRTGRKFLRLGGRTGFPNDVYDIIQDAKGNIWMSTITGLVKYDPIIKEFKKYPGITGWSSRTAAGKLFFQSREGITCFHPDSLKDNTFIPPVVITSFRKFEKSSPFGKQIRLEYDENFISFEFASLNYIHPERNQYAYKMEGVDTGWVYSGTRRFASYPNLPHGEYIFRVKGSNDDGVWNEAGTSITIFISPPFWKTWWAYLTYISVFLTVLYGIRKYEMNRMALKNKIRLDSAVLKEREEMDEIKSKFFANISHEFRTPLTLILGPAEKIFSNTSDDVIKDAALIKKNSRHMLRLINQLMDLSRLDAGKLNLKASRGNVVSFVKGVALSFESLAESKDITLVLVPEKDFIELYFDREKLMKILINLLSNAFKFTPDEGIITVSINERRSNIPGVVEIKIKDTGIGIPAEEIPKLFNRFYQVDSSFTKEHEGTGIGLALTKELVELHKGNISVESRIQDPEKQTAGWTEFTVTLPLDNLHLKENEIVESLISDQTYSGLEQVYVPDEADPAANINNAVIDPGVKTLILLVEDNYDMRQYIKESLGSSYRVEEAVNGEQGFRKAEKNIPDLVITDMMMPKMDGNELTRLLKSNEKTSHIPVILLTARSGHENKLAGLETGADDYLTKPFDLRELQVRIENLIKIRRKLQEKYRRLENVLNISGGKGNSLDEQFIMKVMEVIGKHLSDEHFSIEEFGSEVGMSRTQFHRKFRAITGKPASMFLRSVRLAKAKKMIEEQRGNISEIAYSVGFSSPSYFTKCFHEEFGYPPKSLIS